MILNKESKQTDKQTGICQIHETFTLQVAKLRLQLHYLVIFSHGPVSQTHFCVDGSKDSFSTQIETLIWLVRGFVSSDFRPTEFASVL